MKKCTDRTNCARENELEPGPQFDITRYILTGRENAKTAREIANYIGIGADRFGPRRVTRAIEIARKAGAPICASNDGQTGGFYLAADQDELNEYIGRLESRNRTMRQTIEGMRRGQRRRQTTI